MKLKPWEARELLQYRQEHLKEEIVAALDLLEGYVYRSPSQRGYHFKYHLAGRQITKHVRKRLLPQVQGMVQNHRRVQQLLRQLSLLNWRLLNLKD